MSEPSTTTLIAAHDSLMSTASQSLQPALVIAWSRSEPGRVGEVALCDGVGERVLGRQGGEGHRVRFMRQRPGGALDTGELRSNRISRDQLVIRREGAYLRLRNVGRQPLRVGADTLETATVGPGDLVVFDRALILYCDLRPPTLPRPPDARPDAADARPFGAPDGDGWVGESAEAWRLRQRIRWCAAADGHLLVTGPSGAGKALVARAIHARGRADGPLVERNATTLPDRDLAAELFGQLEPARPGAFQLAHGGTLVLDALGRISASTQAHLLDVLDTGRYHPVGTSTAWAADVRVVGVSNGALTGLEPDFLARFPLRIDVPGLDDRRADVPLIARHLLAGMARDQPALMPAGPPRLHPRLVEALMRRRYTGHVRELARLLWEAVEAWSAQGRGKYLGAPDSSVAPSSNVAPGSAELAEPLPPAPSARTLGPTTELHVWPSLDGESCRVALVFADGSLTLPARTSHLVLLAGARERLGDAARGVPESEQGWMYAEVLADALGLDRQRLNTEVYRARQQIEKLGVDGADRLFERRPQTRQIRLGLTRITVEEPGA